MKRKLLILIVILIVASAGWYVLTMDARGLKNYLTGFLAPAKIDIAISCAMLEKSRQGFCQFDVSESEVAAIKDALHLVPASEKDNPAVSPSCPGWTVGTLRPYVADPPLPPMPGNSRSSLLRLWHDAQNGKVCADMEYPYG